MSGNYKKQNISLNKRKQQLPSCKICKLHSTDFKIGVICSLTNEVANFEKECPSIQIDYDLVDDYEVEIHNKMLAYIEKYYDLVSLKKDNYIQPNYPIKNKFRTKERTHTIHFKKHFQLGTLASCSFFILILSIGFAIQSEDSNIKGLLGILAFFSFCAAIVGVATDYYAPLEKSIIVGKYDITIAGKKISWNDIVEYRIIKIGGKYKCFDLILGTVSGGIQKFSLLKTNIQVSELVEILNLNKKDYFTRFERNLPKVFNVF